MTAQLRDGVVLRLVIASLRDPGSDRRALPWAGFALVWVASVLAARVLPAQQPSVALTRLPEEQLIEIDGRLDEPVWADASQLGALTEVEPVEGRTPGVATVVRLAYDRDFLYIALDCRDDPDKIRARLMARDAELGPDDRVELWIDPFDAQRFAYWFQIGAGGSRGDALMSDSGERFNKRWDGIWYGRSIVTDRGWTAEIALPFKTIGFRDGHACWGFNLRRFRRSEGQELRWASPRNAYRFFNLSVGGKLTGLTGMRQGIGLDFVPYVKASASRDRGVSDHTTREGDVGFDVGYRITPSLNLQLTYNTDFAETEVDERQVNLTRFPLFFPEKRDFFLQDADLFEFGVPSGFGSSPTLIPFFSRRVGLDEDGNPVPILGGVKMSGRQDGWNVGALGALVDETAADPEKGLGVVRVSRDVGAESAVGVVATGGRPTGPGNAVTAGTDFRLRDSEFFGDGYSATWYGYYVASQDDGAGGDGEALGTQIDARSSSWEHRVSAVHIDQEFDPKLGFVRRTGVRTYAGRTQYTWRGGGALRKFETSLAPTLTTTAADEKDTWEVPLEWLDLELGSLDEISVTTRRRFERVPEAFEIREGVFVQPGDFHETRHRAAFTASSHRLLSGRVSAEIGDFLSGDIVRWSVSPMLIPSRYVQLSGEYQEYAVDIDEAKFTTRITEGRVDLTLSPDLAWRNLVQYDSESKAMTVQSRVHWIIRPGHDLFLLGVWGWERATHEEPLVPTTQDLTVKMSYTLRF